jgi:hypothetical protein
MKKLILAAAVFAMAPLPAFAQAAYSSSTTEIGALLDDPAAKAILEKHIPGMTTNDQVDMARAMTLKDIQQYSPDQITDKALAEIDADLAKLKDK